MLTKFTFGQIELPILPPLPLFPDLIRLAALGNFALVRIQLLFAIIILQVFPFFPSHIRLAAHTNYSLVHIFLFLPEPIARPIPYSLALSGSTSSQIPPLSVFNYLSPYPNLPEFAGPFFMFCS